MQRPVALQLYSVRRQLSQDLEGTLSRLRSMGYRAVETYPFTPDIDVNHIGNLLHHLGMEVVAMHAAIPSLRSLDEILELSEAFGCKTVIWHGWPRPDLFLSNAGVGRLAAQLTASSVIAAQAGLELGYHNHWWEFDPVENQYPYRILHQQLPPEIFWELDVYWTQTARMNPVKVIAELGSRVQFLHLKDGPAIHGPAMTPLGSGSVDMAAVLQAAPPETQLVVEMDESDSDIFDALSASAQRLLGSSVPANTDGRER